MLANEASIVLDCREMAVREVMWEEEMALGHLCGQVGEVGKQVEGKMVEETREEMALTDHVCDICWYH